VLDEAEALQGWRIQGWSYGQGCVWKRGIIVADHVATYYTIDHLNYFLINTEIGIEEEVTVTN
jgi:hypothetical protein